MHTRAKRKIMNNTNPTHYEIERKFLIRMPDIEILEENPNIEKTRISQTYLQAGTDPQREAFSVSDLPASGKELDLNEDTDLSKDTNLKNEETDLKEETGASLETEADLSGKSSNRRIRKWTEKGITKYIYTSKRKLSAIKRLETEFEISQDLYEKLLLEKDPDTISLEKSRYRIYEEGFCFELDIFPFWTKQAYLEVELPSEDTTFPLPSFIHVIREVTEEEAYSNYALAHQIPSEDLRILKK